MSPSHSHDPITRILDHAEDLSVAYAWWSARDLDAPDGGDARRAVTTTVRSIDALLAELHQVRSQIIVETREYDAVDARVDALLAKGRSREPPGGGRRGSASLTGLSATGALAVPLEPPSCDWTDNYETTIRALDSSLDA